MNIPQKIAAELNVKTEQVEVVINLFAEQATVPFIARYRKEVTGGLTDVQLRQLEERLQYLTELEDRRQTILDSIEKQEKLTPELKKIILAADDKARLEDLYLPYKPKRRTKAQIAKEAGLEPLAEKLYKDPAIIPVEAAQAYLNSEHKIETIQDALEGARHILMEQFSEHADLIASLRDIIWQQGTLSSQVISGKEKSGEKFSDYFAYHEALKKIPSHRALAVFRGQKEGFLRANIELTDSQTEPQCIQHIAQQYDISVGETPGKIWLWETVEYTWKIKLKLKIEIDLLGRLKEIAEHEAIQVFKNNLKNLLMAPPAGHRITMGLDPGLRTGVKVVVIDDTGKLLNFTTIFPHAPRNEWNDAIEKLAKLCEYFSVNLISIGNGTASRETDRLVAELIKKYSQLNLIKVVVSEAGASVYSASKLAAEEFPELDVSYRGAVSIARRLQDPLAELVKIDPKAIGVGQYQHDVNQTKLNHSLHAILEDCVNAVGADVNTASVPLLKSISGLNETVAQNLVNYREQHGRFHTREDIKKVPRLGDKTFEQAIGFLRIVGGKNPLDASAVHPEAYPVVEQILEKSGKSIQELMGQIKNIQTLHPQDFVSEKFGLPTIKDIFLELQKPGRDPRGEFKTAQFAEGIESLNDLKPGMIMEGTITNVTNFGAFVDIGVHQDGLVHISQLAQHFIADPHQIVKVGQIVTVKVLEIDMQRKRIQLSMRLEEKSVVPQAERAKNSNNQQKFSHKQKTSRSQGKHKTTSQQPGGLGEVLLAALKTHRQP